MKPIIMPKPKTNSEKRAVLHAIRALIPPQGTLSLALALARHNLPPGTFYRWCDADVSGAWDREPNKGGRPAKFAGQTSRSVVAEDGLALTPEEVACLRWFALRHNSAEFGIKRFASYAEAGQMLDHNGERQCPHEPARESVRGLILAGMNAARKAGRRYHPPLSLMRLATVTNADKQQFRSRRAALPCQLSVPRSMTYRLDDGEEIQLVPGALYVADDHDCNNPAMQRDADGVMQAVRQNVAWMDVASLTWLYNAGIARRDNAYRLEDQAEVFERVITLHGWPKGQLIERGPWDNNWWLGTPIPPAWGEPDGAVWGGIASRIRVLPQFKPNGKTEIEQGFNRVQKIMAHLCVDVGRRRGEFEKATRLVKRAKEGDAQALRQFWGLVAQADAIMEAMDEDNRTPHARTALGGKMVTPLDWWQSDARTEPVKASERHLFCPLQLGRTVRTDGTVRVSDADYDRTFVFTVSGVFRGLQELDRGHRVFVCFHPGKTSAGAYIFNAERATARNRDGLRWGEFLGVAPCVQAVPRVVFRKGEDDNYELPQKRSAAIRGEYRSIVPARDGARDNFGVARRNAEESTQVDRGSRAGGEITDDRAQSTERGAVAGAAERGRPIGRAGGGVAALLRSRRGTRPVDIAPEAFATDHEGELVEVQY